MPGILRQSPPSPRSIIPTDEAADAALVARARRDRQAFTPLYERYFDAVYRYCYHRLGSWEEAEDAASLIFTNALAALPRFRDGTGAPSGSFRSWIFAIAHNAIGNSYRTQKASLDLATAAEVADQGPSPEELVLAAENAHAVRTLLAHLPPDQRLLLELRLAGLNDAEIAEVVGMSHGAVRVAQHRAMVRLRAFLVAITPREEFDHDRR